MATGYLGWPGGFRSPVGGATPFTYSDGVTYLEKLEDLGAFTLQINDILTSLAKTEADDVNAINANYTALVANWNSTLARLDPAAVRNLVTGYDTQIAGLNTRVGTIESANYPQQITNAVTTAKAYTDTTSTANLNTAKAYTDTAKTAANAYTDTAKGAANTYTDGKVAALSAVYEPQANLAADATTAVTNALGSATAMRAAFDGRYQAAGTSAWPAQGRAGGVYYLSAYCNAAQRAGTASASPAIAQILSEMSAYNNNKTFNGVPLSGGTIVVDGKYMVDQPIAPPAGLSLIGTGANASGFYLTAGNFFQLGSGQWCEHILCDNFGVDIGPGGGSFLNMTGVSGTAESIMTKSNFRALRLRTLSTSKEIVSVTGYSEYHSNNWVGCEMDRPTASTVGLMIFKANAGNVMNSNAIRGLWAHGHNTTGAPAIIVGSSQAGWQHNWTFEDICGEQNAAGLIQVGGVNHVQIRNCVDWDGIVTYTNPVIRVGPNDGGTKSCNVFVESSGCPTADTVVGQAVNIANNTPNSQINGCNPCGVPGKIAAGTLTSIDGFKRPFKAVGSNYTATEIDENIWTTAACTITLPDPLTISNVGACYTVTNLSGGTSYVSAANGRTVAGQAAYPIPSLASTTFTTDGQYMSANGAAMRWIKTAGA